MISKGKIVQKSNLAVVSQQKNLVLRCINAELRYL